MDRLRNFGFLLKDLSRRYVLRFEQRARAISLTLPQCKVLVRLENNEGISQAALAGLADVEPMMMVRILDRMETDGLLERRPDPADRRARRLYLTKKAKPLLEKIWRLAELTRAETFSGISREDRDAFMDVLERVYHNICVLDERSSVQPPNPVADMQEASAADSSTRRSRKALAK
jgi:MarR family transcriptional regulator, transcriptional regulator for hemolysin